MFMLVRRKKQHRVREHKLTQTGGSLKVRRFPYTCPTPQGERGDRHWLSQVDVTESDCNWEAPNASTENLVNGVDCKLATKHVSTDTVFTDIVAGTSDELHSTDL